VHLPDAFIRRITGFFEPDGAAWLERLPTLLAEIAACWELTLGPPFELSYNYVAPVRRADGTPAVRKLGVAHHPGLLGEINALRHYGGRGACRLLAADETLGALLLERLHPGHTMVAFAEANDAAATRAVAQVMARLWAPPPRNHRYRSVADWAGSLAELRHHYAGTTGPFPAALVDRAENLFAELLSSQAAPVVLHGDLHHLNILAAGPGEWRAIDPQGIIGEPAYEIGAFMRNPAPGIGDWPDLPRVLERRIAIFAETLGLEKQRIHGWALVQAMLNAWWSVEVAPKIYAADLVVAHALASISS
jgi:streptomycin 6-kinase